jgi:hypothetical protein
LDVISFTRQAKKNDASAGIVDSADIAGSADFGSGDCPTNGYVVPNLKIRTNRLVLDRRKLQSPWGRSPDQCFQGRW